MDELIMTMRKVTNTHEALKTRHFFVTLLKHQKSSHVFTYLSVYSKGISRKKPREISFFFSSFVLCFLCDFSSGTTQNTRFLLLLYPHIFHILLLYHIITLPPQKSFFTWTVPEERVYVGLGQIFLVQWDLGRCVCLWLWWFFQCLWSSKLHFCTIVPSFLHFFL